LYWAGSSGLGFGLSAIARRYSDQSSKGNSNWKGGLGSGFAMSCLVRDRVDGVGVRSGYLNRVIVVAAVFVKRHEAQLTAEAEQALPGPLELP
jgi:hypothetical protein